MTSCHRLRVSVRPSVRPFCDSSIINTNRFLAVKIGMNVHPLHQKMHAVSQVTFILKLSTLQELYYVINSRITQSTRNVSSVSAKGMKRSLKTIFRDLSKMAIQIQLNLGAPTLLCRGLLHRV